MAFDVEVYPGRWCVGFMSLDARGEPTTRTVDGDPHELASILRDLAGQSRILVGYNSFAYDSNVISGILAGRDAYELSGELIRGAGEPGSGRGRRAADLGCEHIDLAMRLRTRGRFPSLKSVAARLGRPVLDELPYPPDKRLADAQWARVKAYNRIDLGHTWALLERLLPEIQALETLWPVMGRDPRSTPLPQVVERIYLADFRRKTANRPIPVEPPRELAYVPVDGVSRPRTAEAAAWYDRLTGQPIPVVEHEGGYRIDLPKRTFEIAGLRLSVGAGGLHSKDLARLYLPTRKNGLASLDVASFYPSLMVDKGISPRAYGEHGRALYREILERRLAIMARLKQAADEDERARLGLQSDALKLVLNSTFGKLGDRYSSLFDLRAMLSVTLTGQLMLIDLIERLDGAGAEVLAVNTDGAFIKYRRGDRAWRKVVEEWQADTAMRLEIEPIRRLAVLAANNYGYKQRDGTTKRRGKTLRGELDTRHVPSLLVVNDEIAAALLDDVPPEVTIRACPDADRFCCVTRKTPQVVRTVVRNGGAETQVELGRITRWYKRRGQPHRRGAGVGGDQDTCGGDQPGPRDGPVGGPGPHGRRLRLVHRAGPEAAPEGRGPAGRGAEADRRPRASPGGLRPRPHALPEVGRQEAARGIRRPLAFPHLGLARRAHGRRLHRPGRRDPGSGYRRAGQVRRLGLRRRLASVGGPASRPGGLPRGRPRRTLGGAGQAPPGPRQADLPLRTRPRPPPRRHRPGALAEEAGRRGLLRPRDTVGPGRSSRRGAVSPGRDADRRPRLARRGAEAAEPRRQASRRGPQHTARGHRRRA
jgi:hypothetical protein